MRATSILFACFLIALIATLAVLVTDWRWSWLTTLSNPSGFNAATLQYAVPIVGILLALLFGIWRITIAERQAAIAQRQADMTQADLFDRRFQAGLDMLESDSVTTRRRGVDRLTALATEHPHEYHVDVMGEFAAHLRRSGQSATEGTGSFDGQAVDAPADASSTSADKKLCDDLQAIMVAIGRRNDVQRAIERQEEFVLNLEGANLRYLILSFADLSGVNLAGADLSHSQLTHVNLSEAWLKHARFCYAILDHVNCANAQFWMTNLIGVVLVQQVSMRGAKLRDAELNHADAQGANLDAAYVFGADVSGTIFSRGGDRRAANLTQYQLDETCFDGDNPPFLCGLIDPNTRQPLRWGGNLCPSRHDG